MNSTLTIILAMVALIAVLGGIVFLSVKSKAAKIAFMVLLVPAAAALLYLCVQSIMQPLNFQKEQEARKAVAVQRLKDIRTLENGFKSVYGRYTPSIDTLKMFYEAGKMEVVYQFGSQDDSIADVNRKALEKKFRLKGAALEQKMYEAYLAGTNVWGRIPNAIAVKDTLCTRPDFCIDSIGFIPCCGEPVQMDAIVKTVSGVKVPLFEARIPYGEKVVTAPKTKSTDKKGRPIEIAEKYVIKEMLLRGMDHQLVVNLCSELIDTDRYPGLMVGSISAPNNNAGNWE